MPDDRNWFATVQEPCRECGYDAGSVPRDALADAVRALGDEWRSGFAVSAPSITERPSRTTWSALEYACHTRDVLSVFANRVSLTLVEDEPELGWWDHEAAALDEGYNEQDPAAVLADLDLNADRLARVLATVPDEGWERAGTRRGAERFTVADMARFCLHEAHHHLRDARRAAAPAN
ncbi:MAG: DinB family protein [Acidimicrobiales bacterium]|nr:DinB family protein [Acidimicrobiales bacterium]MCB9372636.1 DinB family protein [Microthrixaceae bacterium]